MLRCRSDRTFFSPGTCFCIKSHRRVFLERVRSKESVVVAEGDRTWNRTTSSPRKARRLLAPHPRLTASHGRSMVESAWNCGLQYICSQLLGPFGPCCRRLWANCYPVISRWVFLSWVSCQHLRPLNEANPSAAQEQGDPRRKDTLNEISARAAAGATWQVSQPHLLLDSRWGSRATCSNIAFS